MSMGQEPQAYGAGLTRSSFNLIEFIKKPQVILRFVAWVTYHQPIIFFIFTNLFLSRFSLLLYLRVFRKKDIGMIYVVTMGQVLAVMVLQLVLLHSF
jgi:hypothetical protein